MSTTSQKVAHQETRPSEGSSREPESAKSPQLPAPDNRAELQSRNRAARIDLNAALRQGPATKVWLARLNVGLSWLNLFPPMRAFQIYTMRHGPLMAAGCAYNMFFSVAAMLVAGFSILGLVVSGNTDLQKIVVDGVASTTPGLIDNGSGHGLVKADQLFSLGGGLSIALTISLVALLFTSLGWIAGLREGVRGVFGLQPLALNAVLLKLKDIATLLLLGVMVVVTSVISFGTAAALDLIISTLNLDSAVFHPLVLIVSTVVLILIDAAVALVIFRSAAGVKMPRLVTLQTALIAAVGSTVLRSLSSILLANVAGKNPLLAPFSVILGLFVWFFFLSQVYLIASGWGAMRVADLRQKAAMRAEDGQPSKGIVQRGTGEVGVLSYVPLPKVIPLAGAVAVDVQSAGLDGSVLEQMVGRIGIPKSQRRPSAKVPGFGFSGIVSSITEPPTPFEPGQAVLGLATGAFATIATAEVDAIVAKPQELGFKEAATLPVDGGTALQAMKTAGELKGKTVLIVGAVTGVGQFLVQLSADAGASVTASCDRSYAELVRSWGAENQIRGELPRGRQWDVIFDCDAELSLEVLQGALRQDGVVILVGLAASRSRSALGLLRSALSPQTIKRVHFELTSRNLKEVVRLAEVGVLRPHLGLQEPLAIANDAASQLRAGATAGSAILTVGERL